MTPREALEALYRLKSEAAEEGRRSPEMKHYRIT